MTTVSGETTTTASTRTFVDAMIAHNTDVQAEIEQATAGLAGAGITGPVLDGLHELAQHYAGARGHWDTLSTALKQHEVLAQQARATHGPATDMTFYTDDTAAAGGTASTLDPGPVKEEDPVNEEDDPDAAFRDYYPNAIYPFLNRHTEQKRIEAEHDARPELIDEGRRTPQWYRAAGARLRARAAQIDRMVAGLRPGDQVRLADDPEGVAWTVRETRDGDDGRVWVGLLRSREDGTQVATGCPARGVDLVAAATGEQHAAMVKAELVNDLKNKWITPEQYDAAIAKLAAPNTAKDATTATSAEPRRSGGRPPLQPDAVAVEWTDPNDGLVVRGRIVKRTKITADIEWPNGRVEKGVKFSGSRLYGTLRWLTAADLGQEPGTAGTPGHRP